MRPELLEHWQSDGTETTVLDENHDVIMGVLNPEDLEEVLHRNWNILKAARQHIHAWMDRWPAFNCAILLFDSSGVLIDLLGSRLEIEEAGRKGYQIGTVYRCPSDFLESCGPVEVDGQLMAWLAMLQHGSEIPEDLVPFIHSACIAIGHGLKLEELRQDAMRVHHSLIGHLDCHVILLNIAGEIVEERHPIPLSDDVRKRMIEITRQTDCYNEEVSMGQRTYTSDARKLWDHTGRLKGKLGIFRDITRNKTLELKTQDVEKLSILTSLAAGIAHEIRNPLTTARGFLQLFNERLISAEDKRFLSLTIGELDRIQRLVTDFMSLAKPVVPHFAPLDITEVVREVADFIQPEAVLQGVSFANKVPEDPIWVLADKHQLKQVILNVVQNALQACTPKESVRIEVSAGAGQVTIFVKDTGCGMTPEQLARIYQPYYTTKSSGTGLGLAVSKRIIHEHGGSITMTSTQGKGTTVQIRLVEHADHSTDH